MTITMVKQIARRGVFALVALGLFGCATTNESLMGATMKGRGESERPATRQAPSAR